MIQYGIALRRRASWHGKTDRFAEHAFGDNGPRTGAVTASAQRMAGRQADTRGTKTMPRPAGPVKAPHLAAGRPFPGDCPSSPAL